MKIKIKNKLSYLFGWNEEKNKLNILEIFFCIFIFIFMMLWCFFQKFNYAPDEYMRFLIPEFIYSNGYLPVGWDPKVIVNLFGASYAYYSCQLGAIISAIFMKIMSLFARENFMMMLIAARFTSVIAGTLTTYFTIKISKFLFNKNLKWLMIFLGSLIPQFLFLSSYVNNDILGTLSSAIIIYAWVCALKYEWDFKNSLLLAFGIILSLLSYQTSYGWILLSVIIFLGFYICNKKSNINFQLMRRQAILICVLVVLATGYFFIRNAILYDGDIIGSKAFLKNCELYGEDWIKPSNRDTLFHQQASIMYYLFETNWIECSCKSFIGIFGYMCDGLSDKIYFAYKWIFLTGLIHGIYEVFRNFKNEKIKNNLFNMCMLIGIIIPIILSLYYSYMIDYQPQGRYCYPILISLIYFTIKGYEFLLNKINNKNIQKVIIIFICLLIFIISVRSYLSYFLIHFYN